MKCLAVWPSDLMCSGEKFWPNSFKIFHVFCETKSFLPSGLNLKQLLLLFHIWACFYSAVYKLSICLQFLLLHSKILFPSMVLIFIRLNNPALWCFYFHFFKSRNVTGTGWKSCSIFFFFFFFFLRKQTGFSSLPVNQICILSF